MNLDDILPFLIIVVLVLWSIFLKIIKKIPLTSQKQDSESKNVKHQEKLDEQKNSNMLDSVISEWKKIIDRSDTKEKAHVNLIKQKDAVFEAEDSKSKKNFHKSQKDALEVKKECANKQKKVREKRHQLCEKRKTIFPKNMRKVIIWSEIMAPPVGLRNKSL